SAAALAAAAAGRGARLRLSWASPAGALPASLQAASNSATPTADAAERMETGCIVGLLMVWVRYWLGIAGPQGQPMCRFALKAQGCVTLRLTTLRRAGLGANLE